MSQHESKLLRLKDTVGHLEQSRKRLEWTKSPDTIRIISEAMMRDLEACRQICNDLRQRAIIRQSA